MTISAISFCARAPKATAKNTIKRCTRCEEKERGVLSTEIEGINQKLSSLKNKLYESIGQDYYNLSQDIRLLDTRKSQILARINQIDTK